MQGVLNDGMVAVSFTIEILNAVILIKDTLYYYWPTLQVLSLDIVDSYCADSAAFVPKERD